MTTFAKTTFNAARYAAYRPKYPPALYDTILRYHKTGKEMCLDLGCGHGLISRQFSPHFNRVLATDPSEGMVKQARERDSDSKRKNVEFKVASAEALPFLQDKSVDLIVAGQAAHWFDFKKTWPELSRVIKPGGTLAFWGYKDPIMAGAPKASALLLEWSYGSDTDRAVGKYWEQPGRSILAGQYRAIQPPSEQWSDVQRLEYEPDPEKPHNGEGVLFVERKMPVDALEGYMRTYSSWHNWQAAHTDAAKSREEGGSGDLIDDVVDEMKRAEGWADGEVMVDAEWGSVLLLARAKE